MSVAAARALELPAQAVPHLRGLRSRAGDASVLPMQGGIPHAPGFRAMKITLGAKDVLLSVHRLVGVKLEGLRSAGISEIEIHLVHEVSSAVDGAQLFPPQG